MGVEKFKRKVLTPGIKGTSGSTFSGAVKLPVETITSSSVAQQMSANGLTFITYGSSGKTSDILIPNPTVGALKEVYVVKQSSSEELNFNTASTAQVFYGTTFNTITIAASTVFPSGTPGLIFRGVSTSQWAVTALGSTNLWDFSASTGSTDNDI